VQIWSLQPTLGAAAMRLVEAAYNESILPCVFAKRRACGSPSSTSAPCVSPSRADKVKEQGLGDKFYGAVGRPGSGELTEPEELAVEYAERFALDHASIADEVIEHLRGAFSDPEILDLTICCSAFLGLGRMLRAFGITETSVTHV
jgi:hypothetical protein